MRGLIAFLRFIGKLFLSFLNEIGRMGVFFFNSFYFSFFPPYKWTILRRQIWFLGYMSLIVIIMTGAFTGMVLALQVFYTLRKFGAESLLGPAIALSLIRELGPVIAALMVTGRAGSALTAEIGIMRITEQIDALFAMALNPFKYVVGPNFVAALISFPLLTSIFDVTGIYGGYLVGVKLLGISPGSYFQEMKDYVLMDDIMVGVYKSLSFGIIVSWICCYKGFHAGHGARGVSKATTEAVVLSSVSILLWDYILGSFFI